MNLNWELLITIVPIVTAFLASLPGAYAIRRQIKFEEVEREKAMKEAESISADIVSKYVDAAGNLQDFYTELMEEVKNQFDECKVLVTRMENKIEELEGKIEELEEGIRILTKQITDLGLEPKYPKEK